VGVFPLLFTDHGLGLAAVGVIKGLYPILWGIGQIPTGHLADRIGRKPLVVAGMLVQAAGFVLALVLLDDPLLAGVLSAVALGSPNTENRPARPRRSCGVRVSWPRRVRCRVSRPRWRWLRCR
jgi:MFS family permease